jgi:hypothetical protein
MIVSIAGRRVELGAANAAKNSAEWTSEASSALFL